jgi:hypothetical protein
MPSVVVNSLGEAADGSCIPNDRLPSAGIHFRQFPGKNATFKFMQDRLISEMELTNFS